MARRRRLLAIGALAFVIAVAVVVGWRDAAGDDAPGGPAAVDVQTATPDYDYRIPAGTGTRLDAGEEVSLLPPAIDATVGQTVRIVNDDDRDYLLGPFIVGAHETMTQRFTAPGTFIGECAVHPSGEIRVTVTA